MERLIDEVYGRIERRLEEDEGLRREIEGLDRLIEVRVTGGRSFFFRLHGSRIERAAPCAAGDDPPQDLQRIVLEADEPTYRALVAGKTSAFKAYMTGRLKVQASMEDLMLASKLTGG